MLVGRVGLGGWAKILEIYFLSVEFLNLYQCRIVYLAIAFAFKNRKPVVFCCSVCILHVHVMFTRLYVFEYKFNNTEHVCIIF